MDLERIKQNLRLRSGRTKKTPKKPTGQASGRTDQNLEIDSARASKPAQPNDAVDAPSRPTPNPRTSSNKQSTLQEPGKIVERSLRKVDSGVGSSQTNGEQQQEQSRATARNNHEGRPGGGEGGQKKGTTPRRTSSQQGKPVEQPSGSTTDQYTLVAEAESDPDDYDLRPPAPKPKSPSLESLSELLFSSAHLNTLIHHPALLTKFTAFLQQYRPHDYPLLMRYLETSKVISAIEYANAVAGSASTLAQDVGKDQSKTSNVAAVLDASFRESSSAAFNTLVNTTLPLYITYSLVRVLSECLVDEITGRTSPLMRDMFGGLSEVFCLTDPNQEDNPIIYASEEFYHLTGFGQDDVIGHNCRFLQGPKTHPESHRRLRAGLDKGEEVYETLLNYRRDGKPFINVLMIAPLHDNKGRLKYHIGAQVDVSSLIQSGRVLDGFQKFLAKREADQRRQAKGYSRPEESELNLKKKALEKLRELSELFDLEESAVVQSHSRSSSRNHDEDTKSVTSGNTRRRIIDSDNSDDEDRPHSQEDDWKLGQAGPLGMSGKLPGVYEKYMLIRPAPSLRIIFVSPKLRKLGDVHQHPFLSHVAAPSGTLTGLGESFKNGVPVSAKINFMQQHTEQRKGTKISPYERHEDGKYGQACWIAATPLLGSDDQVGVWMIVFVEKAQARPRTPRTRRADEVNLQDEQTGKPTQAEQSTQAAHPVAPEPLSTNSRQASAKDLNVPIKPKRLDNVGRTHVRKQASRSSPAVYQSRAADPVEEYHSADEHAMMAKSPALAGTETKGALQSPTYGITAEEDFVRPRMPASSPRLSNRLTIYLDGDDDEDQGAGSNDTANSKPHRSSRETDSLETAPEQIINPDEIEPSVPSDAEFSSDHEASGIEAKTPTQPTATERDPDFGIASEETIRHRSPPQSPSSDVAPLPEFAERRPTPRSNQSYKSNAAKRSGNLPAGLSYMDYLRHPGSSKLNSAEVERGRRRDRPRLDLEWTDSECAQSPYSVD